MDRIDVRFNNVGINVNQQLVATNMAALRNQKDLGPKDSVGRDKRQAELKPEGDTREGSRPVQEPGLASPLAAQRDVDPAQLEQELMQSLLHDLPEEVLAAARQIMKGQMKSKTEPTRQLRNMKAVDGTNKLEGVEGHMAVVEDIFDDAPPLLDSD